MMNKKLAVCSLLFLILSCKQEKRYHDTESNEMYESSPAINKILHYRKELNSKFEHPKTSPLPDRYRKDFKGLDFFPIDTTYIVKAFFVRTPEAKPFLMKTTTNRKSRELVYGMAHFELDGKKHSLEVYRTLELLEKERYEDYLFLPFLDVTNGNETYGGGRYLDLNIPKGDTLVIDFNKAYNPYCVYNKKYSCPLVPKRNHLNTKVKAGEKMFRKK